MPLDTSSYTLSLLRLDGRRWNELRHITGQISTQSTSTCGSGSGSGSGSADGSSYLCIGNTRVLCTVSGPAEVRNRGATTGTGAGGEGEEAVVSVEISVAGFSGGGGGDRRRRAGDRRTMEMQCTLASAFQTHLFAKVYPRSRINIRLHVLAQDGALLATCINAATLALVDAGIPMPDYLVACTGGTTLTSTSSSGSIGRGGRGDGDGDGGDAENSDPLLDLNGQEELELPFLTAATVGSSEKVSVLVCETRCRVERVEGMMAVAVDGCKQIREILDGIVRAKGAAS